MSYVFVLDTNKQQLNPVHPGRARMLLSTGKAAVFKRYPFTIVLKTAVEAPDLEPLRIKIDPGSRTTGLALVNDATGQVVFAAELIHRGHEIKKNLDDRRTVRRSRRRRKTRYRKPRFSNRRNKQKGWLPPSLESRINNIETWVKRLMRLCPIIAISQELVKFDLQHMENPEISGLQYQQGTLAGYELREYLLEKWGRKCAYCGKSNVPLQIEHNVPRAIQVDDRVCNLTLACEACNLKKGTQDIAVFLAKKPELLKKILAQAKRPLKDAAAVNATRWRLFHRLQALGLQVECGSGGLTKFNRCRQALPKTHWLDAACVGRSTPAGLAVSGVRVLGITATGHGNRQLCGTNKYGFPIRHRTRRKWHHGLATGDLVRAVVPAGKHAGVHVGRVAVRASGSCRVGSADGISHKYLRRLQRGDGYAYSLQGGAAPPPR